jgi:hypothetical protein
MNVKNSVGTVATPIGIIVISPARTVLRCGVARTYAIQTGRAEKRVTNMKKKFDVTVENVPVKDGFVKGALTAVAKYHAGVLRALVRNGDLYKLTFRFHNDNGAGNFATIVPNIPLMSELTVEINEVPDE